MPWAVIGCVLLIAAVALTALAWAWRVDTRNVALQARVASLEAANNDWLQWARSEGYGQTRALSREELNALVRKA